MKSDELRKGNWVNVPHGDVQIRYFVKEGAHFSDGNGGTFASLHPIPLTEEWLVKFGFEEDNATYVWSKLTALDKSDYCFDIDTFPRKEGFFYHMAPINHVHQLQNLYFALTGTELEIIN